MKANTAYVASVLLVFASFTVKEVKTDKHKCESVKKAFVSKSKRTYLAGVLIDCDTGLPLTVGSLVVDKAYSTTDSGGTFVRDLPPGAHAFRSGFVGYKLKDTTIQLKQGDSLRITVYLEPDTTSLH